MILFLKREKLEYPLASLRIFLIIELRPSIGPLETLTPSYKSKELAISSFQLLRVAAKEMNSGISER